MILQPKKKQPSLFKRFPKRYVAKLKLQTPAGTVVEIECLLPDDYGKELLTEFIRAAAGKPPRTTPSE